jgi:hypothetical protein
MVRARPARRSASARITRVHRALGLDQRNVSFLGGLGAMLYAPRHDEQLALPQLDVAVSKVDGQAPAHDEEEVIRLVVLVPDELEVVEVADDPGPVGSLRSANFSARLTCLSCLHSGQTSVK